MEAYSQDLRERVGRACDAGEMTQPEVAEAFGVSVPPEKLVSVDESGATTAMTCTRGRGLKGERVVGTVLKEAIEAAGARVLYLPPYSPDLQPIEPCWSEVKERLRAIGPRTQQTLNAAIAGALNTITPADSRGYFRKCGYVVH